MMAWCGFNGLEAREQSPGLLNSAPGDGMIVEMAQARECSAWFCSGCRCSIQFSILTGRRHAVNTGHGRIARISMACVKLRVNLTNYNSWQLLEYERSADKLLAGLHQPDD